MLTYKISHTQDTSKEAIEEMALKLQQPKISFILFFASARFPFETVNNVFKACYPDCTVLGGTSQGELADGAYSEGYLTAISVYGDDFKVEALVLKEIKQKALIYKKHVREAIKRLGIELTNPQSLKQCFAISLIDGLSCAEEKVMMMLQSAFQEQKIHMVGGSCGCLDPAVCYLSANGQIYQDAALLLFVHTKKKVMVYNENIYEPFGEIHRITSADIGKRIVYTADNKKIAQLYAETFAINKEKLNAGLFATHPIGRQVGEKIYITSPVCTLQEDAIKFYARVMPGSSFQFMQALEPLKVAHQTNEAIHKQLQSPKLILGFNCILRYLQFKEQGLTKQMYQSLNQVAPVFGFTTLGEQIDLMQVNQTLTLLAIED